MRGRARPHLLRHLEWGVLVACTTFLALELAPHASRPLTWDEVDYVRAARRGVVSNLLDEGSWWPQDLIRYMAAKASGNTGDEVAERAGYDETEDLFRLRHMHPPLWIVPLTPALKLAGPEGASRWTQVLWVAVLGLCFIWVARAVAPSQPVLRAVALGALLLDPLLRFSLLEMHAHVAFSAAYLLPMGAALARLGSRSVGVAVGALWAMATLGPVWCALLLALLLPTATWRQELVARRAWLRGGAAALVTVGLLWPGGWLRAGLVQEHAFRAYSLLFQGGSEWASAGEVVRAVLSSHPGLAVLALLPAGAYAWAWRHRDARLLLLAAGALALVAVSVPFLIIPRYALGVVPLGLLVILALPGGWKNPVGGEAFRGPAWGVLAVTVVASLFGAGFPTPDPERAAELREEYAFVDARIAGGEMTVAEGGHIYAFYGTPGGSGAIADVRVDYDGQRLIRRVNTHWQAFDAASVDRVVLLRRAGDEPPVFDSIAVTCARHDRPTAVHFLCRE